MESLIINLDNTAAFDDLVHNSLKQASPITVCTKPDATESGRAGVVVSFLVEMPSGEVVRVQAVTTVRLFANAGRAVASRHFKDL